MSKLLLIFLIMAMNCFAEPAVIDGKAITAATDLVAAISKRNLSLIADLDAQGNMSERTYVENMERRLDVFFNNDSELVRWGILYVNARECSVILYFENKVAEGGVERARRVCLSLKDFGSKGWLMSP